MTRKCHVSQVVDALSPGLPPERRVLSADQLRAHHEAPYSWSPEAVAEVALRSSEGALQARLTNPDTGREESLLDLLAFGAPEVSHIPFGEEEGRGDTNRE